MESAIATTELLRTFRVGSQTVIAVDHVSLHIPPSRLTVIRGRSGSGKTTLVNMLGLLDRPDSGSILLQGEEVTRLPESARDKLRRTRIGFVYQTIALAGAMTAFENVDFRMRVAGESRKEREARVTEVLTLVGLAKRIHHRPQQLSGGEQQRVAIARALAHRPAVIFADEPTAELDTATGVHVVGIFKRIIEVEGVTVVMTTHDPAMMELADHVITMDSGRIQEEPR